MKYFILVCTFFSVSSYALNCEVNMAGMDTMKYKTVKVGEIYSIMNGPLAFAFHSERVSIDSSVESIAVLNAGVDLQCKQSEIWIEAMQVGVKATCTPDLSVSCLF